MTIISTPQYIYGQGCNHKIQGTVRASDTNLPVSFAQIYLVELQKGAITDDNGFFVIPNICNGNYTLEISHVECKHDIRKITVTDEGAVLNLLLHHEDKMLGTVTIAAHSLEAQRSQANSSLSGVALDKLRGENLGEALKQLPGVTSLNTGATVSKPIIQGMHSNRVLIFNNGVRLEGQQWGTDHAPEIDPFTADKLTVIKGAGSVQYGADAIGGIVLVEPAPLPQHKGWHGRLNTGYFQNGNTTVGSFALENCHFCSETHRLSWRIQASVKKGGNLKTPNYYLANTGIEEQNFSTHIQYKTLKTDNVLYYSRVHSNIGIFKGAHIGNLDDLKIAFAAKEPLVKADFTYTLDRPLQRVTHDLLKFKQRITINNHSKIITQLSYQYNRRGEFDAHRLFGTLPKSLTTPNLDFILHSVNLNSALEHQITQDIHGKDGLDVTYQRNTTTRGGLIPNYVNINTGAYLTERWHRFDSPWEIESGLRYDYKWMNVAVRSQNPEEEGTLRQFVFQSYAGQLGAIFNFSDSLKCSYHFGTSWRNPNINEMFSFGVHHGTATFERGNINLQSERALNNTFSLKWNTKKWNVQIDMYANRVLNFIYLKPDTVAVQTIRGAFPAFDYTQTNALLMGTDWLLARNIGKHWILQNKGAILRAKNTSNSTWLTQMPADRTQTDLTYQWTFDKKVKHAYLSVTHLWVAKQNRVPNNQDYLPPPATYHLFGIDAGVAFQWQKQDLTINLSIKNLANTAYRDYLNRFRYFADEIGRDVQCRLKYSF